MLLESVEFLIHVDDWIENQGEQLNRIKATDFVANLISSSRNVKLLVTSSENVEFPSLGKEKITHGAFKPEQTFQLLKTVWKNKTVYKAWADQLSDLCSHRHPSNFLPGEGGGGRNLPDIPASCPIFYETVEKSKNRKSFTGAFFSNTVASMFRKVKAKSVRALSRYFRMNFLSLKIR